MTIGLIGITAAVLSVVSFLPQAWRLIKTRKADELATMMWVLNVIAFGLWTVYGVALRVWAVAIPNAICMVLSAFIRVMKLLPSRARHAVADVLEPAIDAAAVRHGARRPTTHQTEECGSKAR